MEREKESRMILRIMAFLWLLAVVTSSVDGQVDRQLWTCGDADGSGDISFMDIAYLWSYIFGGSPPNPIAAGNVDASCGINIGDEVKLMEYFFGGGYIHCSDTTTCTFQASTSDTVVIGNPEEYVRYPSGDSIAIPVYISTGASRQKGFTLGFQNSSQRYEITSIQTSGSVAPSSGVWQGMFRTHQTVPDSIPDTVMVGWFYNGSISQTNNRIAANLSRDLLFKFNARVFDSQELSRIALAPIFVPPAGHFVFANENYDILRPNFVNPMPDCPRFVASRDGWGFSCTPSTIWTPSLYQQYNYSAYPYTEYKPLNRPDIGAPGFTSVAQSSDFPSWPLFVAAFGESRCYFDAPPDSVVFRPSAVNYWLAIKRALHNSPTFMLGGAVTSMLYYNGFRDLSQDFPGHNSLYSVPISNKARELIATYDLYQFGANWLHYSDRQIWATNKQSTLSETQEMLRGCGVDRFQVVNHSYGGGPSSPTLSFVPLGWDTAAIYPDNYNFLVHVYDPRSPGCDAGLNYKFCPSIHYWIFPTWDDCFFWSWGYEGYHAWCMGFTFLAELTEFTANPVMPSDYEFKRNMKALLPPDSVPRFPFLFTRCDSASFTTSSGTVGFGVDSLFNTLGDGVPIIPIDGDTAARPPIGYYLPDHDWNCQFRQLKDTTFMFSVFTDSSVIEYTRGNVQSTQSEDLSLAEGGNALIIRNADAITKSYQLNVVAVMPSSETVWTLSNLSGDQGDSTGFAIHQDSKFRLDNFGGPKLVSVVSEVAGASGTSYFRQDSVQLPASSAYQFMPNWGSHHDSLLILMDSGMTGTFADTVFALNQGLPFKCGDANGDAVVDISDVVYLIAYIFSGGSAPNPLLAGDANCDGIVDISDVVYMIAYIFSGGAKPCAVCT